MNCDDVSVGAKGCVCEQGRVTKLMSCLKSALDYTFVCMRAKFCNAYSLHGASVLADQSVNMCICMIFTLWDSHQSTLGRPVSPAALRTWVGFTCKGDGWAGAGPGIPHQNYH
eukprot:1154648-Pelagomonas_calceolata.AAC.5